jgi:hypothetical protein
MRVELRAVEHQDLASTRKLVNDAFRPADVVTFLDSLRADGCITKNASNQKRFSGAR